MAFPAIDPLRVSTFNQRPGVETSFTVDGAPYVLQNFTAAKHTIQAQYILTSAQWALLIADFETNHSTQFQWDDDRDSPATSRAVYYAGRPQRSRNGPGGLTAPGTFFVIVDLVEA